MALACRDKLISCPSKHENASRVSPKHWQMALHIASCLKVPESLWYRLSANIFEMLSCNSLQRFCFGDFMCQQCDKENCLSHPKAITYSMDLEEPGQPTGVPVLRRGCQDPILCLLPKITSEPTSSKKG